MFFNLYFVIYSALIKCAYNRIVCMVENMKSQVFVRVG